MRTASVSELKAHLSRYLREVRRGGEIQILDRGVPVARLAGLSDHPAAPDAERRERLIGAGTLRPRTGDVSDVLARAPLEVPTDLRRSLDEDRAERL